MVAKAVGNQEEENHNNNNHENKVVKEEEHEDEQHYDFSTPDNDESAPKLSSSINVPEPSSVTPPLGKRKRKPREMHDDEFAPVFRCKKNKKKQPNVASTFRQAVPNSGTKSLSHKTEEDAVDELGSPIKIKSPTMIQAEEVLSSLGQEHPSFLKLLLRSHVASCFWMGLPGPFCKQHLPREDLPVILENESGEQFEIKYISAKTGLSAGWRKFVAAHKLVEGDILIFQLVDSLKFKVYVIRAHDLTELDGALSLLNLDAVSKHADGTKAFKKKKKRAANLPPTLVQSRRNNAGLSRSGRPASLLAEQSRDKCDEVAPHFKVTESFEDFHIIVNGVCIDAELPEHIRRKYHELCCCKKAFLHNRVLPGLYCQLVAGIILEVVNTADGIRGCKLTTPRRNFEIWEKFLKSFELLGMNVGFLRARLRRLIRLVFDSEGASEAKRYWEAKTEQACCEDEIRSLETRLEGLKEASERYDLNIETLRANAKSYELMFQECVNAPW